MLNIKELTQNQLTHLLQKGLIHQREKYRVKLSGDGFKRWKKTGQVPFTITFLDCCAPRSKHATKTFAITQNSETPELLARVIGLVNMELERWQAQDGLFFLNLLNQLYVFLDTF